MDSLDNLLQEFVVPSDDSSVPDINGVVAGFTNSKATRFIAAKGVKNIKTMEPIDIDTKVCIFSCTKIMTATAILILWERGLVDLDQPAKAYLPLLGEFGVIDENQVDDDTGKLKYPPRKPKNDVTIRHLLLNNSGFAYMFTDSDYFNLMSAKKVNAAEPSMKLFAPDVMPLLFEPGTKWKYGHSMDWVGFIVQAVSGQKLSEFLKENVFDKAGMAHSTFRVDDRTNMMSLHYRSNELLKVMRGKPVPHQPDLDMGGQGCFSTVGDYLRFLRIWLNYGTSPDTGEQILKRDTVEYAIKNHLPEGQCVEFETAMNKSEGEFIADGFTLAGCAYNNNDLPTGRPAGSIYWGGLASLYFWLDFKNDCAGFFGCQVLPYLDLKCLVAYIRFEHGVYELLKKERAKI